MSKVNVLAAMRSGVSPTSASDCLQSPHVARARLKTGIWPIKEGAAKVAFTFTALVSILAVALICVFLFANGIPGMAKIGVWDFLSGEKWKPGQEVFGILPFILGSVYVTAGALVVGVPAGLMTALFLSRFASKRMVKLLRPAVQLLAGIPSVVYGFFGLVVLVPLVRELFGGTGSSLLTASVLLGMMILPTIITVAESALNAVPAAYYEGALALGATHERSVFHVILPAAKSGVMAGIILGVGRAIGEATAVMMVAGNRTSMPKGLLKGVRTLTSNIVIEMGYAGDLHREALIATAVVLFVFILLINVLTSILKRRVGENRRAKMIARNHRAKPAPELASGDGRKRRSS